MADDEPWIRDIIGEYLGSLGYACQTAPDGEAALQKLRASSYDLLISDINMPGLSGVDLFDRVRGEFPDLAMMMLTGVRSLETAVQMMKGGLYDYLTKPVELEHLRVRVEGALQQRSLRLQEARILRELRGQLAQAGYALDHLQRKTALQQESSLEMLVRALDAREKQTQMHSLRVQAYAVRLSQQFSFSEEERHGLARGALLHDIGKIGVPDAILLKPGSLTAEEWEEMRRHPEIGFEILHGIDFLGQAAVLVLNHHERFDGSGYPRGLKGSQIPLPARIFSLVDAFDALTNDRPYRRAIGLDAARAELAQRSGSQFDPRVVEAFLAIPTADWEQIRDRFR